MKPSTAFSGAVVFGPFISWDKIFISLSSPSKIMINLLGVDKEKFCKELQEYVGHHEQEIKDGDHHDPNALELFCDLHPDEPECLVYDD